MKREKVMLKPVRIPLVFCVLLALAYISLAYAAAPPAPTLTAAEETTLAGGKPVFREEQFDDGAGHRSGRAVAYIIIQAPPEKIWAQILDYDHYAEFYPNVHSVKLTKKEGNHYYVYFVLDIVGIMDLNYNVDHTYIPEDNRLTWKMDQSKTNDFKETTGFWQIWPRANGQSLVCYSVYIETGKWVPGVVQKAVDKIGLTTWSLQKVVNCMKKRVELGAQYKGEPDRKLDQGEL